MEAAFLNSGVSELATLTLEVIIESAGVVRTTRNAVMVSTTRIQNGGGGRRPPLRISWRFTLLNSQFWALGKNAESCLV